MGQGEPPRRPGPLRRSVQGPIPNDAEEYTDREVQEGAYSGAPPDPFVELVAGQKTVSPKEVAALGLMPGVGGAGPTPSLLSDQHWTRRPHGTTTVATWGRRTCASCLLLLISPSHVFVVVVVVGGSRRSGGDRLSGRVLHKYSPGASMSHSLALLRQPRYLYPPSSLQQVEKLLPNSRGADSDTDEEPEDLESPRPPTFEGTLTLPCPAPPPPCPSGASLGP